MILLLSVSLTCLVSAQESEPPELDFGSGGVGEGETVEVPVDYLRNALWYYDNYWIQKELAETYRAEYDTVDALLDEEQQVSAGLEASLQVWKSAAIVSGGTLVLWIALNLVVEVAK